jgi:hypothetical protein
MKQFVPSILILVFILNVYRLNAQEPSRFPILPTSVWRINYEYSCLGEEFTHESGDQEYKYFVNGDTLIAGRTYFKLYKTGILYLDTPVEVRNKYMGAIRDSANRFYFVEEKLPTEHMIYNFDAKVGESLCPECDGIDYIVGDIVTLENGRKKFYIDVMTVHCGSANALVEGIGWLGGLLEGNACYAHPGIRGSYLLCYSENGTPVYETEESPRCGKKLACNNDITSINQSTLPRITPEITLRDNQSLEICFPDGTTGLYNIEIYSVIGQKMKQLTLEMPGSVDVSSLGSGTFLLKFSDGQIVSTSKFMIR